jgi:hypothetical protein
MSLKSPLFITDSLGNLLVFYSILYVILYYRLLQNTEWQLFTYALVQGFQHYFFQLITRSKYFW